MFRAVVTRLARLVMDSMLLAPTIALGGPSTFAYHRAHSLFWVVRSTQLSRLRHATSYHATGSAPCFRCRQLEPLTDRQPLTSRTAVLTRAAGEQLAAAAGEDVAGEGVWRRLWLELVPQQAQQIGRLYRLMPKDGPGKLRLL